MKWLKSTTQKVWTVDGKVIPACVTSDNSYLKLDNAEYARLSAIPVVRSLIKAGAILVLSEEPAEIKNSLSNVQASNASLRAQNTELKSRIAQLESTQVDVEAIREEAQEAIRAEAVKELQEKEDEIAELKKQLKAAKKADKE